jgi:two-component system, cell cycle sensor histidine kinase and response regulator CckA
MVEVVTESESALSAQAACHSAPPLEAIPVKFLIYVVDDEPLVGGVVETILQMDGFNTQCFLSPEVAMKAFEQADPRPQLLVTDFVMGAVNGMELIDHCLRLDPFLKTVLYSGNVGEEIMRNYLVQPDRFVSKPFHPKQLSGVVRDLLSA